MMISQRLRQLRLARGLSLEELSEAMGGVVTKQALSKYENGKSHPSAKVLNKLASALGVKAAYLCSEPSIRVELMAYRKRARLPKREQSHLESLIRQCLEDRVWLQEQIGQTKEVKLPVQSLSVCSLEDTEIQAIKLRQMWNLGLEPIGNIIALLEDRLVHVMETDAGEDFDGLSAVAYSGNRLAAAAVITSKNVPGERQRLNVAHELGHLVLRIRQGLDEEKAAFRFGAAFLAPAITVRQLVGEHRKWIDQDELRLLKMRFGMSMQALLYRLKDLGVITESYYRQWCMNINRLGWKRSEPDQMPKETPTWLRRTVWRALAEGLISLETGQRLLGPLGRQTEPPSLTGRRSLLGLPLEQRRQLLAKQAEKLAAYYEADPEWRNFQGGDFVDYDPSPT